MRWWLTLVARRKSEELFVLNLLLVTLALAWLTELVGLSLALGASSAKLQRLYVYPEKDYWPLLKKNLTVRDGDRIGLAELGPCAQQDVARSGLGDGECGRNALALVDQLEHMKPRRTAHRPRDTPSGQRTR